MRYNKHALCITDHLSPVNYSEQIFF